MTAAKSPNVMRYGSEQSLPARQTLSAGPVTAVLEGGDLRYVRLGRYEIVRRLYMAVRDQNWGTIEPVYTSFSVQDHGTSFEVDFTAEHVSADVEFAWTGRIEGRADGTIRYQLDGAPRTTFLKNRIGFCVLHPSELAGLPATTETPDGVVNGKFPERISPDQPFLDMTSITHEIGDGGIVRIEFDGDLFEMEDQRNWTDASYKTYSTPLALPYPVEVTPDTTIKQSIEIRVSGQIPEPAVAETSVEPEIRVDFGNMVPLPPIGFGAGLEGTIEPKDMDRLQSLAPTHLWVHLDLGSENWRDELDMASARAEALETGLELSVVADTDESNWSKFANKIQHLHVPVRRVFVFPAADDPVVFPRTDLATHSETVVAARTAFSSAGLETLIGGGTIAYFTEFNRAQSFLPVADMAAATYTINPQVHAFDNLSIVECIEAQIETVRSARAIAGDIPLVVGPITLKPPFNPNATGPAPDVPADALPPAVDARQLSLLGAGWTLGSIHRLAEVGADAMTYYELYGWRGLIERRHDTTKHDLFPSEPGQLFPLYHVFAAVSPFAREHVCAVELRHPLLTEALVLRSDNRVRILVASFAEKAQTIHLHAHGLTHASVQYLDDTTYEAAMDNPDFVNEASNPVMLMGDKLPLTLNAFAVAIIDGTVDS